MQNRLHRRCKKEQGEGKSRGTRQIRLQCIPLHAFFWMGGMENEQGVENQGRGFRKRSCSSTSWAATTLSQTNREGRLTGMENAIYYAK